MSTLLNVTENSEMLVPRSEEMSGEQGLILSILADGPLDFRQIRRQLYHQYGSETRATATREHLSDLVASNRVVCVDGLYHNR